MQLWASHSGSHAEFAAEILELCGETASATITTEGSTAGAATFTVGDASDVAALCASARLTERLLVHVGSVPVCDASGPTDPGVIGRVIDALSSRWDEALQDWFALGRAPATAVTGVAVQLRAASKWRQLDLLPLKEAVATAIATAVPGAEINHGVADVCLAVRVSAARLSCGLLLASQTCPRSPTKCGGVFDLMVGRVAEGMEGDGEVWIEPMCGEGKLLCSLARANPGIFCIGVEIESVQVALCRARIKHAGWHRNGRVSLIAGDARCLPMQDGSVDGAVCDLPFGRESYGQRSYSLDGNRELYRRVIAELHRVVRPNGRVILLTTAENLPAIKVAADGWELCACRVRDQ